MNHAEICNGSGGYEDSELATFIPALFSREIVKKTLSIPTIDDNATDFDILFNLWNQTNNDNMDVTFEFSNCNFLRQNAIAFLGGLIRLIQSKGGTVWFNLESISKTVKANLERNGFIPTLGLGNGSVPKTGNSIPYREDSYQDKDVVVDYLGSFTLGLDYKITKKLYATDSYDLDFDITNNLTFVYGSLGIDNDKYFFENPNFRAFSVETINMTTIFTTVNSTETTNSRYLFLIGVKLLSILLLIL